MGQGGEGIRRQGGLGGVDKDFPRHSGRAEGAIGSRAAFERGSDSGSPWPPRNDALAILAIVFSALATPAQAQSDYPNKPITLVIPLPPGGTNDIMARAVADKMSAALGQQVVVENRAAAGSGTVSTRAVRPRTG